MSTNAVSLRADQGLSRTEDARGIQAVPREIGHPGDIGRGSVLVKPGTLLLNTLMMSLRRIGSWNMIALDAFALARTLIKENWYFSFVVPSIKKTSRKRTREKALRAAVEKLVQEVTANNFNAVEVTSVAISQFIGLYRVEITGHASHISDSPFLNDRHGLLRKKSTSEVATHSVLLEIANTPRRLRSLMERCHKGTFQWPDD